MAHNNAQVPNTPKRLSSLADWSAAHIRAVFEALTTEASTRAIVDTFSPRLVASLNGTPLDYTGLCGLVNTMRASAPNGLKVEWASAQETVDDPEMRNGSLVGEYCIRGIWRSVADSGPEQRCEFERRKKVVVRIESQSPDAAVDSRLIVKLDILASDVPAEKTRTVL
ncbi:hypothetical protein C8F04DRAFT_701969 [Mycena alexandri]|uniref:Uncharacterized protein n=1 Tax=Mycena alexandri TaxID=1745969 RepID=A0AAD6SQ54_9AGAR|nr:hypothetical protein C8F04DRAFT_701969 [Mycena alexandri]